MTNVAPSSTEKTSLTAIVQTHNMVETIGACLETLEWVDDLLVVDDFSDDGTAELCEREYGARVLRHERKNAAAQKNWTIPQAWHEWVLVVDADERVTPELRRRVEEIVRGGSADKDFYRIQRWNMYFGRIVRHCGWDKDRPIRLFRREARYQDKHVHADVIVRDRSRLGFIREPLIHVPYASFDAYFKTLNKYSTWGAEDLKRRGVRPTLGRMVGRPFARFLKQYLLKRGFLDGRHGLVLCLWASVSVLAKYCKLWEMETPKREKPE
ncbi:glycosyltransferase family 2 protein [Candidatus Sumerlaeota bacterium]|nr:glycosyltransferase family 2 protein [Candidatus Sumerlaeota bacterium]